MRRTITGMLLRVVVAPIVLVAAWTPLYAQGVPAELRGQVNDEDGIPVARAEVTAHWGANSLLTIYTDAAGQFQFAPISEGQAYLSISKPGFFRIEKEVVELESGPNEATFTLNHENELQEKVEVRSAPAQIDPNTTSHQQTLVEHEILNTPVPVSHDLTENLVTMPNVLMDASGRVHVAGARQGQTEILLDGFEINDPTNASFAPRVNVDAVQAATVETGGYGAQYAHAGAGVLTLDTKAGDDKWRFGATNFVPGVNIRQGAHFANWYPRATLSGPIEKGGAWFSDAFSVQHHFSVVNGLPPGQNFNTGWAGDNLLRLQVNLTPKNILQASFLLNRASDPELGLGPFTPLSTTTNVQSSRYFVSLKDQVWMGRTLVEVGVAGDTGHSNSDPQGNATYVVKPSAASGKYFQTLAQQSRRLQLVGDITSGSYKLWGMHTLSGGWNVDGIDFSQHATRNETDFDRFDGTLSDRATFTGPTAFRVANTQVGGYAQDLWRPVKPFVFSVGLRADWDRLIHQTLSQPRLAMNWVPLGDGRMKFTVAWGEHYQPINLAIIGQAYDQQRIDVFYANTGLTPLGNPIVSTFLLPHSGLSQPRSSNTTAEWDERIFQNTFVGAAFLLRQGHDSFAWELQPSGTFLLQNHREDRFISEEVWIRHAFGDKADVMLDYTRSRANSNEVLDPSLTALIFAPQQPGDLPWDAPNRLLSRAWTPLPVWQLLFSYFFEYRTGFPFSAVNDQQHIVGLADSLRYPSYLNLNLGVEKSFRFRKHEWAIRVSGNNITEHENADAVVNDVDSPSFLTFGGGRHRSFSARLRLVTQH